VFGELKSYIYLRISVDPSIATKYEQTQPTLADIIPKFIPPTPPP